MTGEFQEEDAEKIIDTDTDCEQGKEADEKADVSVLSKKEGVEYLQRNIYAKYAGGQETPETGECKAENFPGVQFFYTVRGDALQIEVSGVG